jgi:hypothetical protein
MGTTLNITNAVLGYAKLWKNPEEFLTFQQSEAESFDLNGVESLLC